MNFNYEFGSLLSKLFLKNTLVHEVFRKTIQAIFTKIWKLGGFDFKLKVSVCTRNENCYSNPNYDVKHKVTCDLYSKFFKVKIHKY